MMRKWLFFFVAFFPFFGFSAETEQNQEIRVQLATSSPLQPIYIGKIQSQDASFDTSYLAQLEAVLAYDLNYNGATKVSARSPEKEQILLSKDNAAAFNPTVWKNFGIPFAIRLQMSNRMLGVSVFNSQGGSLKSFPEVFFSGDLNKDRQQLHKIADAIHKSLFNHEGIASSRILYSYQVCGGR